VNLNTASAEELQTLPRVGPALAERILAHVADRGGFGAVEDLLLVSGIGERTLAGLRDLVTV
ncbi:ComEA family DNA-binding protein, partial [Leucobacter sp. M11]|uniref:ComEA family DNA-binding protein n=1 Tax=Leucobacter sp. M11 TaxID=2993565 RepID=UPI002D8017AE